MYTYVASEQFWRAFYALPAESKERVRAIWKVFQGDPFHPSLGTHKITKLSARYKVPIFSVPIEGNLRVIFSVVGNEIKSIDVGTHDLYK